MKTQKTLPAIAAIVFVSTWTANALEISLSLVKHDRGHARKVVVLPAPHRKHFSPAVVHTPLGRRIIFETIGPRPCVRRPIGHYTSRRQHAHRVLHHPGTQRSILMAPPKCSSRKPACGTTLTIWIFNANGSRTPVTLTRRGAGYVGPNGEYYCARPTHRQLRVVYGF